MVKCCILQPTHLGVLQLSCIVGLAGASNVAPCPMLKAALSSNEAGATSSTFYRIARTASIPTSGIIMTIYTEDIWCDMLREDDA